jgi:hydrogenase/urease accessory protein HupE
MRLRVENVRAIGKLVLEGKQRMAIARGVVLRKMIGLAVILLAVSPVWAHGIHGTQVKALSDGGPVTYMASGAIHMLTGYDHLLFLAP